MSDLALRYSDAVAKGGPDCQEAKDIREQNSNDQDFLSWADTIDAEYLLWPNADKTVDSLGIGDIARLLDGETLAKISDLIRVVDVKKIQHLLEATTINPDGSITVTVTVNLKGSK